MRFAAAGALACALWVFGVAAPAEARPHAVIALLPGGGGEKRPLLEELAARGMAIGMTSPAVGGFKVRQVGLDITQGTRIPVRLYSGPIGALRVRRGHLTGWARTIARAAGAPGDLQPGLLATAIERAGGRVGYAVHGRGFSLAPVIAADSRGRVARLRPGDALDVVQLARGAAGLRELDVLLARRGVDGFVYVLRAPSGTELQLLPSGVAAAGVRGQLRSVTTRRTGLIAATDVAPSVLRALRVPVPSDMQGETIVGRGAVDPHAVEAMAARLSVVTKRRPGALLWFAASWLALLALLAALDRRGGLRAAARVAFVAALWLPGLALLTAALKPGAVAEYAIVGVGAVLLGALTDRAFRWPLAPAVPATVVFLAHAVDLARGSPLIGESMAGPNPAGGARFFGIGNELEVILSVSVLIGTGAALAGRAQAARRGPLVFAAVSFVAAGIMGAGRLGADVGAVITLGAGGAAAAVASLPRRPTRRAIALAIAAPLVAVGALVLLDLATGGGAHLTRTVVHGHGSGGLGDVIRRRFDGSFSALKNPAWALAFAVALAVLAALAGVGRRTLATLPRPFSAALIGAWFAAVVGAAANDSGPLILVIGAILVALAYAYARACPRSVAQPFE